MELAKNQKEALSKYVMKCIKFKEEDRQFLFDSEGIMYDVSLKDVLKIFINEGFVPLSTITSEILRCYNTLIPECVLEEYIGG